ncbi:MAG: guanylate kinase [Dehalococcoidia bacterium]
MANQPARAKPLIVVISGPSGVGKDVMIEKMIQDDQTGFHFTVTATTRAPRPGEKDGVNHHFVKVDDFINLIAQDDLLEWAQVYGNYYGVPKQQVRAALGAGKHVIMRVDVQGAKRLRELVPEALMIFIQPPSLAVLEKHLRDRGVDTEEEMTKRLAAAGDEMRQTGLFDYAVTNEEGDLDSTVQKVVDIISEEAAKVPARNIAI